MDRFGTALELKTVDTSQRIIAGYAAAGGLDRVGDVIDMSRAFTKTLAEKQPSDIAVFIAHKSDELPVGIPVKIQATAQGLYCETKIFEGPAGDNLLAVARGLQAHGQTLGLSIGYRIHPGGAEHTRVDGKSVRLLTSIDLHEYSFAARQSIANPEALVTGVKTLTDEEAKAMPYHIVKDGEQWCVHDDTGKSHGCSDSHAMAIEHMRAMYANETPAPKKDGKQVDLPDSAYLYIAPGGELDTDGKTLPRSLRHFPYRDDEGKTDPALLRVAMRAIPQSSVTNLNKGALTARAQRLIENAAAVKSLELDAPEWLDGVSLDISAAGFALSKIAEDIAEEQAAQRRLGEDVKAYRRIRTESRERITEVIKDLEKALNWAKTLDQGMEERALIDRYERELALTTL